MWIIHSRTPGWRKWHRRRNPPRQTHAVTLPDNWETTHMNNNVINFDFNSSAVRVVELEGKPWFVAADIRDILGFTRIDNMLRHLDASEKVLAPHQTRGYLHHKAVIISESGLYKLVMRSDKPEARAFQDWVTKVVLPAIREKGGYVMGEEKLATEAVCPEGTQTACARLYGAGVHEPLACGL